MLHMFILCGKHVFICVTSLIYGNNHTCHVPDRGKHAFIPQSMLCGSLSSGHLMSKHNL